MKYRKLGNTGLMVSEIGLGGEWLERHNTQEVQAVMDCCREGKRNRRAVPAGRHQYIGLLDVST